ncbi:MAG TPA: porin [Sphingomicrobium sp.]
MRTDRKWRGAQSLAALIAAGLVLTPAIAAPSKRRAPAVSVSFDPVSRFTPANADPRLAAAFAGRGASLNQFKFTPSAAKSRPSQVRIAIRAPLASAGAVRVAHASGPGTATPVAALTPTTYNLGVGVGWRRFAVAGDVAKVKSPDPAVGDRESAVVGVSYSLKRFTGRVAVGADRGDGKALAALRKADNYSLDLGGSYDISRRVAVTGGVRYRIDRDRLAPARDERRDSQAVYVGTAFKF